MEGHTVTSLSTFSELVAAGPAPAVPDGLTQRSHLFHIPRRLFFHPQGEPWPRTHRTQTPLERAALPGFEDGASIPDLQVSTPGPSCGARSSLLMGTRLTEYPLPPVAHKSTWKTQDRLKLRPGPEHHEDPQEPPAWLTCFQLLGNSGLDTSVLVTHGSFQ